MKKCIAMLLALVLVLSGMAALAEESGASDKASIEAALNLKNNPDQMWSYSAEDDAWTLSIVSAVTRPVIPDEEGVSVCVPGAYVTGIDTDGDGAADVTAENGADAVKGSLVIDYEAEITSTHGQTYTAATAPVILNTGAAGYGNSTNTLASAAYAAEGYINVACGNRGKQDSYTDADGNTVYTGDAPSCLADQKAATRFVKYNILLGNLPGSVDYWVSTGGSGGGAHAVMFAATSNNPDFYDYQIAVGAVGVYKNADGSYSTTVTIDGQEVELSDGAWGCVGYSPITSLYEADMAMAFEYTLDPEYSFNTDFQKALAGALSQEYMTYINAQNLTAVVDGETVPLTIEYDAATGEYSGSYIDLYLSKFTENLQNYVNSLDYAEGWTWFDQDGNALSDEEFAAMTLADKVQAFVEGRYDKGSSGRGGRGGMGPSGMNGKMDFMGGEMPDFEGGFGGGRPDFANGEKPDFGGGYPGGDMRENTEGKVPGEGSAPTEGNVPGEGSAPTEGSGDELVVGTPDQGTTQASGSSTDSGNYETYADMVAAYEADIAEIEAGDAYGRNIVELYNPLHYIGAEGTENPVWMVMLCGAAEGDISMLNSMNLEIVADMAGIDATSEWQWDGGHVPSEIFGSSMALRVDAAYVKYAQGDEAAEILPLESDRQTANGMAESASGTDLTEWVSVDADGGVSFALADIAAYRTNAASKATPGFDVIDYGQEDYVFGDSDTDARHWSEWVLKALRENADVLEGLFNAA